ncbi:hypothetical protein GCM10009841_18510 [Microlunatus panaciterrae]|uniref:Hemerythrin superfamily protein n=1 Tax=Microlunatus panaciterrae TaxID=400768 RepID=A0ABS2RN21_9ACTN|nr:hemerythrin domain-containing protein [Microlunatus panaciterrae]MBM7800409.1 hemerythrin superfamily protein [Microlunatus panaciterrae]
MTDPADVVDLIEADHRELERLFQLLMSQPERRSLLLPEVASLLVAHSRAEESEVYPAAREAGETDEVAHSQHEHEEAEQLLERLTALDPEAAEFDDVLRDFVGAVAHHVGEEEQTVLPGLRERLSDERRKELAVAFSTVRAEHLGDKPGEATRDELVRKAQNADISGAASMTKDEARKSLRED